MSETLLDVRHLKKYFRVPGGTLHAVDDVSFRLDRGKVLGVVGESGCGSPPLAGPFSAFWTPQTVRSSTTARTLPTPRARSG